MGWPQVVYNILSPMHHLCLYCFYWIEHPTKNSQKWVGSKMYEDPLLA
jgi:hypothetical protein